MRSLCERIPAEVWSAIVALLITVFAGAVWGTLVTSTLRTTPAIPWAVSLMALLP